MWRSPTGTAAGTWTNLGSYLTFPGLTTAEAGNIYTCKVYGNRIYFGGESGVMSCDLGITACTIDYLPHINSGQRNFSAQLADVDEGTTANPTMMLEGYKQDITVTGYTDIGRWSGGTWSQLLSPGSGIPQFLQAANNFDTANVAIGTGTSRRYYYIQHSSSTGNSVYKSTDSTGLTWASFYPASWPTSSSTLGLIQIDSSASGAMWAVFSGTSAPIGMYVTP